MQDDFADITHIVTEVSESPTFLGGASFIENVYFHALNGYTDILALRPVDGSQYIYPADVQIIGQIAETDCRLLPCGGWKDNWHRPLVDTKAVGSLVAPIWKKLDVLWRNVPENVVQMQNLSSGRHGYTIGNALLLNGSGIKIRHTLFKSNPCPTGIHSGDNTSAVRETHHRSPMSSTSTLSIPASILNQNTPFPPRAWVDGCVHDSARHAMSVLLSDGTLHAQPIPVYDVSGKLLPPSDYRSVLPGALVYVKVKIIRQYLTQQRTINLYADIQRMQILRPRPRLMGDPKPSEDVNWTAQRTDNGRVITYANPVSSQITRHD
ncbi:hypothetical protein K474DRAFT_1706823 [Panus rudis PR-1116 ss-1]|nr:hypothetical protein K474DRAFT_1706823 [Panus rudis PR-1116 ss-1]